MPSGKAMPFEYLRGIEENERAGRFWLRGELPVVATKAIPACSELLWIPADTPRRASGGYKDVRITYKTNAHGWRSREIDPASPNKKIMFVGCSFTMGIGLPYEDVWTSVATRHLEAVLGEPVEQHNFGYGAHGNDFFAMVVHQVLPILKPDFLVVLFSDLSRRTVFPKFGYRMALLPTYVPDDAPALHRAYLELQSDANDFMDFVRQHSFIDTVAKLNGIPWVWQSTNGPQDRPPLAQIAKYVRTDNIIDCPFPAYGPKATEAALKRDLARDGMHPGPLANKAFGLATAQFILGRGFGAKEEA
jgi:hypothetical protein